MHNAGADWRRSRLLVPQLARQHSEHLQHAFRSPAAKSINALTLTPDGCRYCSGLDSQLLCNAVRPMYFFAAWGHSAVAAVCSAIHWILFCVSLSTGKLLSAHRSQRRKQPPNPTVPDHLTGQCRAADKAPPFLHSLASSLPPPAVPSMKHLVCMLGPAVPAAVMLAPVGQCRQSHHAAQLVLCLSEGCHPVMCRSPLVTLMSSTQLQTASSSLQFPALLHAVQFITWVQQHVQAAVVPASACMMWL